MTQTYKLTGMTCSGCAAKIKTLLGGVKGVTHVAVDLARGEVEVDMDGHISTDVLKGALAGYPKYEMGEVPGAGAEVAGAEAVAVEGEEARSWWVTYKPLLFLFGYILLVAVIAATTGDGFDLARAMRVFMSGFFLSFSFFKWLDVKGFAESYAMYDIIARRWKGWGYVYALVELGLGIAFAMNWNPVLVNAITMVVMTVSIVGVLQSVFNKKKIRCACLGAVFNLPMSTVTIIEDGLMIVMSAMVLMAVVR